MRRKAVGVVGAACAMVASVLLFVAGPADAQGYPPGCISPSSAQAGNVAVGATINIALAPGCRWNTGAPLTVTVNGTNVPGKVANSSGGASVVVHVVSSTQLEVDDPVSATGQCGTNTVVARGASSVAQGGQSQHTETFNVLCPSQTATVAKTTSGRVALTGANLARWSAIALGLILVGGAFVIADRRKARARD